MLYVPGAGETVPPTEFWIISVVWPATAYALRFSRVAIEANMIKRHIVEHFASFDNYFLS
jgi:hypothetical protein